MKKLFLLLYIIFINYNYSQNNDGSINLNWNLRGNTTKSIDFLGSKNLQPLIFKTNNVERGRFSSSNNSFLIGNTVDAGGYTNSIRVGNSDIVTLGQSAGARVGFGTSGGVVAYMELGAYSGTNNIDTKTRDFKIFSTANNDSFFLQQSTGNIGINNNAPLSPLHVTGVSQEPTLSNHGVLKVRAGNTFMDFGTKINGNGYLQTRTSGGVAMPFLLNPLGGNVGINNQNPTSNLYLNGSYGSNATVVTGNYTIANTDNSVLINNGTANVTITFPDPTTCIGREILVKKWTNTDTGIVILTTTGGKIQSPIGNFSASAILNHMGTRFKAVQNGAVANWIVIGNNSTAYTSVVVNSGVPVTLDNIRVQLSTTGNRSLQWASVSGTFNALGTSSAKFPSPTTSPNTVNTYINNPTITTTFSYITSTYNFLFAGNIQEVLFYDATNLRYYRITCIIGLGYNNSIIRIERL